MLHLTPDRTTTQRGMFRSAALTAIALLVAALPSLSAAMSVTPDLTARSSPVSVAPALDGKLTDACWQGKPAIDSLTLAGGARPRKFTSVSLAHDSSALYIAFRCGDTRTGDLTTGEKYIWRDDSVEVLIDADRDRRDYIHFFVSVSGAKLAWHEGVAGVTPDTGWRGDWDAKVDRTAAGWTAEIRIPFRSLGVSSAKGLVLRANFARNEQELKERASWMPRVGAILNAHSMGNLLCSDAKVLRDAASPPPAISGAGRAVVAVMVLNETASAQEIAARASVGVPGTGRAASSTGSRQLVGARATGRLSVRVEIPRAYQSYLNLWANSRGDGAAFLGSYRIEMPGLAPLASGAVLASPPWGTLWEANATSKVLPDQSLPRARSGGISLACAGNEYEPFQIVLTPDRALRRVWASVSDLRGPAVIRGDTVTVRLVATVPLTQPTGPDIPPGDYPDPLMPMDTADLPAGSNTALWFTVHAAAGAASGVYRGQVTIAAAGEQAVTIPLTLRVFGFSLPAISHLQTAYGCDVDKLCRWQGVSDIEDKKKVADLAWQNFLRHRMSPFSWRRYWDIRSDVADGVVKLDFTDYDAGHDTWLPFVNAFNVPGAWMRGVGNLGAGDPGYPELKKQFVRQVGEHLKEKGWFEKGYNYIFDEPDEDQYAKVIEEARIWKEAAPGLRILLTEPPDPRLDGWVDIWTPVLDAYNEPACRTAQAKGDEVWWYVCMGPKHPFPNNFIDYPAIDHRILHWMNWKYGVTGVLYWQTTYWSGDPWEQPMSFADDGKPFGNGDGRLLYPAVLRPSETPVIAGPIDSIRWELIREGIEDYDYLIMLSDRVREAEAAGEHSARVRKAKAALGAARGLVRSLVDYESDPARLYAVRNMVAESLEGFAK